MYADDTKLFRRVDNDMDRAALQKDWDQLSVWSQQWQLRLNVDKCKIVQIGGSRNLQATYVTASATLQTNNTQRERSRNLCGPLCQAINPCVTCRYQS